MMQERFVRVVSVFIVVKRYCTMAPPASRVPVLIQDLVNWLATSNVHPLIASCIFHCEFPFIHPFADGNGRMGRLWQTLMLRPLESDTCLFTCRNGDTLATTNLLSDIGAI